MAESLPPIPIGTRTAFIAYLDTRFGRALAEYLLGLGISVSGFEYDPVSSRIPLSLRERLTTVYPSGGFAHVGDALIASHYVVYELVDDVDDALNAIEFLSRNPSLYTQRSGDATAPLKRFVLVSSVLSWFATPRLLDSPDEEPEPFTEDQYNRRVPHAKYLAWRDVEKLVASAGAPSTVATAESAFLRGEGGEAGEELSRWGGGTRRGDTLLCFVVFAGLQYGYGENVLEAMFRQAWRLGEEGLPIFGTGMQRIPMIHTKDLGTIVGKLLASEEPPSCHYIVAVDEAQLTWEEVVAPLNTAFGNGKTFIVPPQEYPMYDNVEFFTMDLLFSPESVGVLMGDDEAAWHCRTGFAENIELIVREYREAHDLTPLRLLVTGPPLVGKTYTSRALAEHYSLPHLTLSDCLVDYRQQLIDLKKELVKIRNDIYTGLLEQLQREKHAQALEERRAARDAELEGDNAAAAMQKLPDEDDDAAVGESDAVEEAGASIEISAEEMAELRERSEQDAEDESVQAITTRLEEVRMVLDMVKSSGSENGAEQAHKGKDPRRADKALPNPRELRARATKSDKGNRSQRRDQNTDGLDDGADVARVEPRALSDTALALIVRWRLTQPETRNRGYILDGFPESLKQTRLIFEDTPLDPTAPEEPEPILEPEPKSCADTLFPTHVINLAAGADFLLRRLQKVEDQGPHNTPDNFQKRFEQYKMCLEGPQTLVTYLEAARTAIFGARAIIKRINMETAPLVPPPPPASQWELPPLDKRAEEIIDFVGEPHNLGPTVQELRREEERRYHLALEQKAALDAKVAEARRSEEAEIARAEKERAEQQIKINEIKERERALIESRTAPQKEYLMKAVVPLLARGLVEVCRERPEEPVEFLADWLYKHNPEDEDEPFQAIH